MGRKYPQEKSFAHKRDVQCLLWGILIFTSPSYLRVSQRLSAVIKRKQRVFLRGNICFECWLSQRNVERGRYWERETEGSEKAARGMEASGESPKSVTCPATEHLCVPAHVPELFLNPQGRLLQSRAAPSSSAVGSSAIPVPGAPAGFFLSLPRLSLTYRHVQGQDCAWHRTRAEEASNMSLVSDRFLRGTDFISGPRRCHLNITF